MEHPKRIDAHIESDDEDFGRDWLKIDRSVKNVGFRIGIEASQEQSLQSGFNTGFREALQMALAGEKLQGGICAKLSYEAGDKLVSKLVSSSSSMKEEPLSHDSQNVVNSASSPLQSLLSSNFDLISGIPSLLESHLRTSMSARPRGPGIQPDCSADSSDLCCLRKDPVLEYLEIFPASKDSLECTAVDAFPGSSEQKGSQAQENKQALSCEHVCNSKSHFWSQLEHFKMQAQSLGVLSSQD